MKEKGEEKRDVKRGDVEWGRKEGGEEGRKKDIIKERKRDIHIKV